MKSADDILTINGTQDTVEKALFGEPVRIQINYTDVVEPGKNDEGNPYVKYKDNQVQFSFPVLDENKNIVVFVNGTDSVYSFDYSEKAIKSMINTIISNFDKSMRKRCKYFRWNPYYADAKL